MGQDGDQLDFSLFTGRGGSVGTGTTVHRAPALGADPIIATDASVVVFANDPLIDTEAELEGRIAPGGNNLVLGPSRKAVVLIQEGADAKAYYVQTNEAGMVTAADVNLVATLQTAASANLAADNFIV